MVICLVYRKIHFSYNISKLVNIILTSLDNGSGSGGLYHGSIP
nr:MAG TPA: Protein of unknown function (DUF3272) [Bacteriophage sp.]